MKQEKHLYHGLYVAYTKKGDFEKRGSRSEHCRSDKEFRTWLNRTVKAHYKKQGRTVMVKVIFSQKFL